MTRTTHTNLDASKEERINDCWNVDGARRALSKSWTGFTKFTLLNEKPFHMSSVSGMLEAAKKKEKHE